MIRLPPISTIKADPFFKMARDVPPVRKTVPQ
jgi:hypothetical protein